MMLRSRTSRKGIAWLELLLVLAVVALLIEVWPSLGQQLLSGVDIRNWSSSVKFLVNLLFVLVLVGIRFGPDLFNQWRERHQRIASERAKVDKALMKKKERETLERMQESRRRRMY